ncbi:MAG: ABC transporter permease [Clostridiales bacterium]|nr:ABC transporter permease [Clostridiales bacterium]
MKTKAPNFVSRWAGTVKSFNNTGVLLIMLLFIVIVVIVAGPAKFFNPGNLTSMIRSVSVVGIMACAFTLVMVTGNIDLSLGWMVGLGACICAANSAHTVTAILMPILVCGICGAFNGLLVGHLKLNAFITTLGTMYIFQGIAYLYADAQQKTMIGTNGSPVLKFLGQGSLLGIPVPVWLFFLFALIFGFILSRTGFGTRVYAVGANSVVSRFSGISSGSVIFTTYLLGGLVAGLASVIFFSKVMATQVYSGQGLEFSVLSGIVLGGTSVTGGKGNVVGTVLGVVFVGILLNGFTLMGLSANVQYVAQGLILLIAIRADAMQSRGLR